jgi:hypothetical protein
MMAMLYVLGPILVVMALLVVVAVVVDRQRRTPRGTDQYDRLSDSPRPAEAHRLPPQSDEYRR